MEEFKNTRRKRRKLLPWWISIFCWLFMVYGFFSIICLILGFTNIKPPLAFYGFQSNSPFSISGLLIISIGIIKGFTAYGLWYEKKFAITLAQIDAIFGIVLCGISMLILPFYLDRFDFNMRFELIALIPYLITLNKIKSKWK